MKIPDNNTIKLQYLPTANPNNNDIKRLNVL